MKCQKCGAEIPAGSKFCNECGTKIEQVALFKDIEPESKEPYKCEKCGKIIPSNSVFCPECHAYQKNKFNPTSDTEKYPYSDDEADVHFYVKNKMDKSITIQADTVILDGRSYNQVVCSDPISAHSEGMIEVSIDNCKNFNPSTVGADLRYFDSDNFGSTVKMNLISKKVK